jgi:hypothetical protein
MALLRQRSSLICCTMKNKENKFLIDFNNLQSIVLNLTQKARVFVLGFAMPANLT